MNTSDSRASGIVLSPLSLTLLLAPSLGLSASNPGSGSAISVASTIEVSADDPLTPMGETWLATNPRDPKNMIAVSMAFPKNGPWASTMYYTVDSGSTWHRVRHGRNHDAYFWGADPHVQFGPDGVAYYTDLEWGAIGKSPFDVSLISDGVPETVYIYRSTDGGRSWSEPIDLDGDDHSVVAVDATHDKYHGRVYVSYTSRSLSAQGKPAQAIGFAVSDDGGRTYRQRVFSPPDVSFLDRILDGPAPTDIAVGPDGTVVLAYLYYLSPPAPAGRPSSDMEQQTWVMSSTNGGWTFSEPHLVATSLFSKEQVETASKLDYWPRMAVDSSSGPNRGRLYVTNESNQEGGVHINVLSSSDVGQTWSDPVRVDDGNRPTYANTPGIAVDHKGILAVAWYDRRNDPENDCFQEYFSLSVDGGTTFLPSRVVRKPSTCTDRGRNWQPNVTQHFDTAHKLYQLSLSNPGLRFDNGGETQGIAALGGGGFELAWIDGESGVMRLAATPVSVAAEPLGADIGDLVQVDTTLPTVDPHAKTASVRIVATNRTQFPLPAPLTLVISNVKSVFDGLQAVNAENGLTRVGASWQLKASADGKALAPGDSTVPVVLRFKFSKAPDSTQDTPPFIDFHLFERRSSASRQ